MTPSIPRIEPTYIAAARQLAGIGLIFAAFLSTQSTLLASGCNYPHTDQAEQFEGGVAGRVASFYWWTQGPVIRVYENGRFSYYQVPSDGTPCDGPECRGKSPQSTFREVAVNTTDSQTSTTLLGPAIESVVPSTTQAPLREFSSAYSKPHLSVPTRPPICAEALL